MPTLQLEMELVDLCCLLVASVLESSKAVPVGCRSCLQMSFHQMMRMWMRTMATMRQRMRLKTEMKEEWEKC